MARMLRIRIPLIVGMLLASCVSIFLLIEYRVFDYFDITKNKLVIENRCYGRQFTVRWVGSLMNKNYGGKSPFDTILIRTHEKSYSEIPDSYGESKLVVSFDGRIFVKNLPFKKKPWIKKSYRLLFRCSRNQELSVELINVK